MHFSVMVVGPDPESQMAPFRSFSGIEDEFVVDVDTSEEKRRTYACDSTPMLRGPGGKLHDINDRRFYRDATPAEVETIGPIVRVGGSGERLGLSYEVERLENGDPGPRASVLWRPPGFEKVMIPISAQMTFEQWANPVSFLHPGEARTEAHRFEFAELNSDGEVLRYVVRTNPNGEYDSFSLGGSFCGFFPLRTRTRDQGDHLGSPSELEAVVAGWNDEELPDPDLDGESADQTSVGHIDFERARIDAEQRARARFSSWMKIFSEHGRPKPWAWFEMQEKAGLARLESQGIAEEEVETAGRAVWRTRRYLLRMQTHDDYRAQPAIIHWRKQGFSEQSPVDHFGFDEQAYVASSRQLALAPFAILFQGKWYEDGSQSWPTGSPDLATWGERVCELYASLPPKTLVTIFDCHC